MRTLARSLLAAVLVAAALPAQSARTFESILTFRTVKVAEGVYAFVTPEERSGFQAGNSLAIIGDDGVLVVDTGNIPSSTRRQIAEIRKLTNRPVRFVVNTHWHPDHNLGNREYRAAFPGVTIVSTSATRANIIDRMPVYFGQMKGFAPTDSILRLRLSTGKQRDGAPLTDTQRVMWTLLTDDYAAFMPEMSGASASPPDVAVDDSLTVMLGARAVKILSVGRANTAGDLIVSVPDARVVATGDLITMPCPFPSSAYFGGWIAALDRVSALEPQAIVPGHGDVEHDATYLRLVRELLVYTREQARAAVRKGLTLEQTMKTIDFADFVRRFGGDDVVRRESFDNFYASAAVQRAWEEAKYESQGPITEH